MKKVLKKTEDDCEYCVSTTFKVEDRCIINVKETEWTLDDLYNHTDKMYRYFKNKKQHDVKMVFLKQKAIIEKIKDNKRRKEFPPEKQNPEMFIQSLDLAPRVKSPNMFLDAYKFLAKKLVKKEERIGGWFEDKCKKCGDDAFLHYDGTITDHDFR